MAPRSTARAKRASAIRPPIRALNGSWRPHGSRCKVSRWRLTGLRLLYLYSYGPVAPQVRRQLCNAGGGNGRIRSQAARGRVMLRSQNGASKQRAAVIESVQ